MKHLPYLLPAALLRLVGLFTATPWYDELYTYHLVQMNPLQIVHYLTLDFNPPLWEFVLWVPMQIAPSVYTQRIVSFGFSLVGLWLAWEIARRVCPDHLTGYALLLCAPGLIWPGQDGRVYALFTALYLASILAVMDRNWVRLFALCGLMLYGHGTGAVWVGSVLLFALVVTRQFKPVILTGSAALLAWLPWLPYVLNAKDDFYRYGLNQIDLFVNFTFTYWPGVFATPLLILAGGLIALSFVPFRNRWLPGWLVGWLPLVMIGALSTLSGANLFIYRVMQIALPTLLLFAWSGWVRWAFVGMTLIGLAFWNPAYRGGYLENEMTIITDEWKPGDVIFTTTGTAALPVAYELDEPVYVWNDEHHPGLLRTETLAAFGFPLTTLDDLDFERAWIITPAESLLTPDEQTQIEQWTANATRIGTVWYWQAAKLEIYLLTNN